MKKKITVLALVILLASFITGCQYYTNNAIIFNDNWKGHLSLRIGSQSEYGPSQQEFKDVVKRFKMFFPDLRKRMTSGKDYVELRSTKARKINELSFIKKEKIKENTFKIIVKLPTLVEATDTEGNAKGGPMGLQLYLPGKIIEANTINYNNDYTMKTILKGKKRARVYWELSANNLATPTKLWVKIETKN